MASIRRHAFFAALAVALAVAAAPGAQARPQPEEFAGVNIQKLIFELPATSWWPHFQAMDRAGIELVRFDALWQRLEPDPPVGRHAYRWERFDAIVGELAKLGIRWVPILAYATKWSAESTAHYASPPRDPAQFAEYAKAVASRYGRGGSYWREHPEITPLPVTDYEVWNAPNNPVHWHPRPDPARYARLYLAARQAVRSVDPDADLWVGGLAGIDAPPFVEAMYAAEPGLRGKVDAVAIHPYAADAVRALRLVVALRRTLDALGEQGVAIPVNEIGWATQGSGAGRPVAEAQRARYLEAMTETLRRSDCGVWTVMPHTWVTRERDPFDAEDWFGLYRPDATAKPSGEAYARAATAPRRRADLALCGRSATTRLSRKVSVVTQSRGGRRLRLRRTCHVARVRIGGTPVADAPVRFEYLERRGRRSRVRVATRTTLSDGTAHVCRTTAVGRASRRPLHLRRVVASPREVVADAVAQRRMRLP